MYSAPHQESPACWDKNGNQLQVVARGSQDCFMPLRDQPSPLSASLCTFSLTRPYIRITVHTLDPSNETKRKRLFYPAKEGSQLLSITDSRGIHCINHNNSNEQGLKSYLSIREVIMAMQSFLESCLEIELQLKANSKFGKFHSDLQLVIPRNQFFRLG